MSRKHPRSSSRQGSRKLKSAAPSSVTKPGVAKPGADSLTATTTTTDFEAEVLPGLEPFAAAELQEISGVRQLHPSEGAVRFGFSGETSRLSGLRTVVAVYACVHFSVPRPKALLGHEHLTRLLKQLDLVRSDPEGSFHSFRFGAAGEGSGVLTRLGETLARETGLTYDPDAGELLIRLRRTGQVDKVDKQVDQQGEGWEVLLRLTPRPLSARRWRVCNLAGGLNAGVAAAMLTLAEVRASERMLNAMCGSGTLAIEQGLQLPPARLLGCDLNPDALACTRANALAAGVHVELLHADAVHLPLPEASLDVIVADPPWGDAVGSHGGNRALYPAFLREMARLSAPRARFVLLTHELKLFEQTLTGQHAWEPLRSVQVFHGGHYPRIYLLKRRVSC